MSESRLTLALEEAGGLPDAGRIVVLHPSVDADLTCLPKDRTLIVCGFRPDHDIWAARGWAVAVKPPEDTFAAAVVFVPRAKALARALVAQAASHVGPGGMVWVDGQKVDGVDPLYRDCRARVGLVAALSKAHGRAFAFRAVPFADWAARDGVPVAGFVTRPGVFSADGVDPGSALLAAHLPPDLKGKGADLGAGWGWLASQVLSRPGVTELHLVEAEADALDCAVRNIQDTRAQFHWADATAFHPGKALDFVVMNPPFHQGRAADPGLGAAFIRAAAAMLQPAGRLFMVSNRGLPYEEVLRATFAHGQEIALERGFRIWTASRPIAPRKRPR